MSGDWKPDPVKISKRNEVCAGVWQFDYDKPIFDDDQNEPNLPNSPELKVRSDPTIEERSTISGTKQESGQQLFLFANVYMKRPIRIMIPVQPWIRFCSIMDFKPSTPAVQIMLEVLTWSQLAMTISVIDTSVSSNNFACIPQYTLRSISLDNYEKFISCFAEMR